MRVGVGGHVGTCPLPGEDGKIVDAVGGRFVRVGCHGSRMAESRELVRLGCTSIGKVVGRWRGTCRVRT